MSQLLAHRRFKAMPASFPFLTAYDPLGSSEGSLDPLGLSQIAERLAEQLVPAVRERMQRIRFLTVSAVGAYVTESLEDNPANRDASPSLVWEWLVVEALVRSLGEAGAPYGVPGIDVTRRALENHGYLDARSYLKTPRVFGFNGVYKRLAVHLGLLDIHLAPGPQAEGLVDAWAKSVGLEGFAGARTKIEQWRAAVKRSLEAKPPHARPAWSASEWEELAGLFAPGECRNQERRYLKALLLEDRNDRSLGALPTIWELPSANGKEDLLETRLHQELVQKAPRFSPLVEAIGAYETFSRALSDAFDFLRAVSGGQDARGYELAMLAKDRDFVRCVRGVEKLYSAAHKAMEALPAASLALQSTFSERFGAFGEPMDAVQCAARLCAHHETIQTRKSAVGKRPWFERLAPERIFMRPAYRTGSRPVIGSGQYVGLYRGAPIRRFIKDLT